MIFEMTPERSEELIRNAKRQELVRSLLQQSASEGTTATVNTQDVGVKLGNLDGQWNADMLQLSTTLRADPDTSSIRTERDAAGKEITMIIGAHPDTVARVTFELRRGTEPDFAATCVRLKRAAR